MEEAISRKQLERIIETIAEGILIISKDGIITYANDAAEEVLGAKRSELLGRPYSDPGYKVTTLEGKPYPIEQRPITQALRTGKLIRDVEYAVVRPDGSQVIISVNAAPLRDEAGATLGVVLTFADITTRKQAEESLKESERRFRDMLEEVDLIALILDTQGNVTFANDFLLDLTGRRKEEVIGKSWFDIFIPEERREEIRQVFHEVITREMPAHYENDIVTREGDRRTIAFSNVTLRDRQGNTIGTASIGEDITVEKQAAEEIRESRRQVLDILESITDGFFALDKDWRFTYVNNKATQFIGKKKEELLFRNMWEAIPEVVGTKFDEEYHRAVEEETPVTFEVFYPPLNKWFEVHAYPFENGLSAYLSDITERKRVEEALKESENRYRILFEDSPVALWEQDASEVKVYIDKLKRQEVKDFRAYFEQHPEDVSKIISTLKITDVNRANLELFKASSKEDFIRNIGAIFTREALDVTKELLIDLAETGKAKLEAETTNRTLKGDTIYVSVRQFIPLGYEETLSRVIIATVDITQRRQTEEALKESENRYRTLFESAPVSLWEEDASEFKAHIDELKGQGVKDFGAYFEQHPEVVPKLIASVKVINVNKATLELFKASSKEEFMGNIAITFTEEAFNAARELMVAYAEGKTEFESETTNRTLKGDIKYVSIKSLIPPGYEETLSRLFVAIVDITKRKKAEEALRKSEATYRAVFNGVNDAIAILDAETGAILDANYKVTVMYGYTSEEIKRLSIVDLSAGESPYAQEDAMRRVEKAFKEGSQLFEWLAKDKYGKLFWIEVNLKRATIGDEERVLVVSRDISERKREKELSDALNDINSAITSTMDFKEIMQRVIVKSAKAIGSESAVIFLREGGYWVARYLYGFPHVSVGTRLTDEEAKAGALAARIKRPVVIDDAFHDERVNRKVMEKYNIRSLLSVPLIARGDAVGNLYFGYHSAPVGFTEAQVDFASKLAAALSVAIENARLFEDLTRSTNELDKKSKDLQALLDVAVDITSGLDLDVLMHKIARHAAELTGADIAGVGLVDEQTGVTTYPFLYNLPEVTEETKVPPGKGMSSIVVSQRKPVNIKDYQELPEKFPIFAEAGLHAIAMIPLWSRGRVMGTLVVSNKTPEREFSEQDIAALEAIGRHASIALDNARLYEAEHRIADILQEALLIVPEHIEGVEFGHLYHSATETARVGGDFYDIFEIEHGKVGIVMGDISGKGIEATTMTSVVKNAIKAHTYEDGTPALILAKVNNMMVRITPPSDFVTLFFGVLDVSTGELTYCSAGHPPAIIKRGVTDIELLNESSPIVGAFPGMHFRSGKNFLKTGDVLVLYTDGVIEARRDGEFFGEERLASFIKDLTQMPAKEVPNMIFDEVMKFTGGKIADDIAILTVSLGGAV